MSAIGPSSDGDLTPVVVMLIVLGVILFVGVSLLSGVAGAFFVEGSVLKMADGDSITIDDRADTVEIWDSTENQLHFASGQSQVEIPGDGGVGTANSTAVIWASLDGDALQTDNYHVANLGNATASLQFRSGQWYAHYNRTDGGYATVTAPAPAPTERSMVGYRANATHLAIVHEGGVVNATAWQSGNSSVPPARSWWGDLDEHRVWATPLNASQFGELQSDPLVPMDTSNETLRMMMDEGSGADTYAVGPDTTASFTGGVSWSGNGLDATKIGGDQYSFDSGSGIISIVDGTRLDKQPFAYIEYQSDFAAYTDAIGGWIMLAGLLFILLPLGFLIVFLSGVRGGGRR